MVAIWFHGWIVRVEQQQTKKECRNDGEMRREIKYKRRECVTEREYNKGWLHHQVFFILPTLTVRPYSFPYHGMHPAVETNAEITVCDGATYQLTSDWWSGHLVWPFDRIGASTVILIPMPNLLRLFRWEKRFPRRK